MRFSRWYGYPHALPPPFSLLFTCLETSARRRRRPRQNVMIEFGNSDLRNAPNLPYALFSDIAVCHCNQLPSVSERGRIQLGSVALPTSANEAVPWRQD